MKKYMFKKMAMIMLCVAGMMCLNTSLNGALAEEAIDLPQKYYVQVNQITFSDNKIYIDVDNLVYVTPAIFSDENGYYIEKVAESGNCGWYEWECSNKKCKVCNLRGIDWECRACGRPISGNRLDD